MDDSEAIVRNIVYDDDNIVGAIKKQPHSYYSLLGDFHNVGTFQFVLRRRIRRLLKENRVWRIRVPGTRFGLVIFTHPEKDYILITKNSSKGVNVFYCYVFDEHDDFIVLNEYYELTGRWNKWVLKTTPLKLLKNYGRDGGLIIWD